MNYLRLLFALLLPEIVLAFSHVNSARPSLVNSWGFTGSQNGAPRRPIYLQASSKTAKPAASTKVKYQKVVKPSAALGLPDILFLGYLVEYLESHFELPSNLPMVYESVSFNKEESRCILAWDSPLSPSSEATRMEVEVVGIYTDKKKNSGEQSQPSSVPNMAMVVVRKSMAPDVSIPPMMENLFADSETKIIKALERGLEDFLSGKIKFDEDKPRSDSKIQNVRTVEEAIEAELVDGIPDQNLFNTPAEDVVFDTYATTAETETLNKDGVKSKKAEKKIDQQKISKKAEKAKAAAMATMQVKADSVKPKASSKSTSEDFAIQAAKKAKEKISQQAATKVKLEATEDYAVAAARKAAGTKSKPKTKKRSEETDDFAVAAARKVAASKPRRKKSEKPKTKGNANVTTETLKEDVDPLAAAYDGSFKAQDYMGDSRAFKTTISRPRDRRKPKTKATKQKATKVRTSALNGNNQAKDSDGSGSAREMKESIEGKRNLNVKVVDSERDQLARDLDPLGKIKGSLNETESSGVTSEPSKENIEIEIMKASQKVLSEMADQTEDMTPEELLQDILKFDEEMKKEEAEGSGFVSGAFEKAKELMRERFHQREAQLKEKSVKETSTLTGIVPDIIDPNENDAPGNSHMSSEEEELRRMFEAGERIADGRITTSIQNDLQNTMARGEGTTEEDIDALISGEKSISSYARILDEELAELEVCINNSPGEELDGPQMNPIFDIMSGPEVYNPNVDPESVNFPGALPGTKSLNLPRELNEAIKQAKFAAEVLSNIEIVESKNDNGSKREQYFAGKQELSTEQVENMRRVVAEATEIGLIDDPLEVMADRSRLQVILDELWNQPDERFRDIAENYKDLLLSNSFVTLVRERLTQMADRDLDAFRRDDESLKESHARERELLGKLVVYAQVLLKEARALGAELEAQQLEIVRSICKIAMDPRHTTEEETAMALTDAVRDMRPLLDDVFVAYLKYAVAEEEARLARAGLLDDPEHNQWLFVLKIVQQGVYTEISRGINRYIDHIGYVVRMETPFQRRMLLSRLIDDMPTMDVRPFVQVVDNIVGSLGDGAKGDFDMVDPLGEMTNNLLQLHRDVKDLLPPERIALKSRDADEWAAKQKKKLMDARKFTQQRLQAARDTEHLQEEIEQLGRRGEMERIE